jgi:divalent metal cation (Fe/Co/Zn/Cd) transporter
MNGIACSILELSTHVLSFSYYYLVSLGSLIAAVSSFLGLMSITLLIAVIVAIFLGYRLFQQPWKKTAK